MQLTAGKHALCNARRAKIDRGAVLDRGFLVASDLCERLLPKLVTGKLRATLYTRNGGNVNIVRYVGNE